MKSAQQPLIDDETILTVACHVIMGLMIYDLGTNHPREFRRITAPLRECIFKIEDFLMNIKFIIYPFYLFDYLIDPLLVFIYGKSDFLLSNAYRLNFRYNNIHECGICLESFNLNESQTLLYCGHRYHSSCINRWKQQQMIGGQNLYTLYNHKHSCPTCRESYNRYQEWDYRYCIGHVH